MRAFEELQLRGTRLDGKKKKILRLLRGGSGFLDAEFSFESAIFVGRIFHGGNLLRMAFGHGRLSETEESFEKRDVAAIDRVHCRCFVGFLYRVEWLGGGFCPSSGFHGDPDLHVCDFQGAKDGTGGISVLSGSGGGFWLYTGDFVFCRGSEYPLSFGDLRWD